MLRFFKAELLIKREIGDHMGICYTQINLNVVE